MSDQKMKWLWDWVMPGVAGIVLAYFASQQFPGLWGLAAGGFILVGTAVGLILWNTYI